MITGKKINELLELKAEHALYREDGKWYHRLKAFPGILCDQNGYIAFNCEMDYLENSHLQHGQDLHVKDGISYIPGYTLFTEKQRSRLIF